MGPSSGQGRSIASSDLPPWWSWEGSSVGLAACLRPVVMGQHHQNHRHQGVVRTSQLVQQRCYWPGMFIDIKHWCQECEHCQVSKGEQPVAHSFMGHLLDSWPNETLAGLSWSLLVLALKMFWWWSMFSANILWLFQPGTWTVCHCGLSFC